MANDFYRRENNQQLKVLVGGVVGNWEANKEEYAINNLQLKI